MHSARHLWLLICGLSCAMLCFAARPERAVAQGGTIARFRAAETPEDDFHLSRPNDFGNLRVGAQIHIDYANDSLVYDDGATGASSESFAIIRHHVTGTLGLSLGLFDRLVLFGGLPVALLMNGASAERTV